MSWRWRDRVVGQQHVPIQRLLPHPDNWRRHSEIQRASLESIIEHVGTVQTVVWNRRTGHVLDGHLRRELADRRGERELRVTVVDLEPDEERLVLATFDPLGAMAETDADAFRALVGSIEAADADVAALLEQAAGAAGVDLDGVGGDSRPPSEFPEYGEDIEVQSECPKCGYRFSGNAVKVAKETGEVVDGAPDVQEGRGEGA